VRDATLLSAEVSGNAERHGFRSSSILEIKIRSSPTLELTGEQSTREAFNLANERQAHGESG